MSPLQPLPASLLLSQDPRISRRQNHDHNAPFKSFSTGSHELDSHILLNRGFEPGSVVGISSEEEDTIGLGIGLQVIARMLLSSSGGDASAAKEKGMGKEGKAMIITTLSTTSLLPRLRLALVSEAKVLNQGNVDRAKIKRCLERVLVARVFDVEGLREVLRELETPPHPSTAATGPVTEEEGIRQQNQQQDSGSNSSGNGLPDIILITNTSHLLNTLFSHSKSVERSRAHNSAVELSDQIRALSKKGSLIMMLNSTTSNSGAGSMFDDNRGQGQKQPELSIMRSIFNPPLPPTPTPQAQMEGITGLVGYGHGHGHGHHLGGVPSGSYRPGHHYQSQYQNQYQTQNPHQSHHQPQYQNASQAATAAGSSSSKRTKPSYGMVFSQMLDLHLLCTKQPRGRSHPSYPGRYGGHVWAVEVLLDELGVYEGLDEVFCRTKGDDGKGKKKPLTRMSREQRWGAVEIEEGSGRVVDAFR